MQNMVANQLYLCYTNTRQEVNLLDNAEMLASIDEIDGGLIALTRFQGEIGYYPEEYLEIIRLYMGRENNK